MRRIVLTIRMCHYQWDDNKRAANLAKHGVDFDAAEGFDWDTALVDSDTRHGHGEKRFIAVGRIGARLHVMIFTLRGASVRIISLRKANKREERYYGKAQKT